ncbi:MAG: hypothetical protein HOC78_02450 [Candidatus Komeilibacteria bacterium]|jgi:hypothetical protein|nr:hypothetical protein [Candidatus Komeilibacteria bacterium]
MLINKKITVMFIVFLTVIFLLPELALAQAADVLGTNDLAEAGVNLGTRDLKETIAGIVNIFLGFLGILATLIILYGGFIWMTSQGNTEKVDKAKQILINGVIGLTIVLSSYAIARFVLREGYDGAFGNGSGSSGGGFSSGAGLGAGTLDSHYPIRYATDVARNTNIYLTFKEPMDVDMIVADSGCNTDCAANSGFINLYEQGNTEPITGDDLLISYSIEPNTGFRTFQLNPVNDLGNPRMDVRYTMVLGDLETQNGSVAFPHSNSYTWNFTTGTEFDFTPPTVVSVRPIAGSTDNPRNSVLQINFSEAINPALATGIAPAFTNISLVNHDDALPLVSGEYRISNQYRTIELITTDLCGVNSCGGDVFCLPASDDTSPDDFVALVTTNIADMADNHLESDYTWVFATTGEIDLTPPTISQMQNPDAISLIDPIEVTFDKQLLGSSINSSNIGIAPDINYWMRLLDGDTISIRHDRFDPSSYYTPTLTSGIKDLSQNCWYPCVCDAADASCVCNNRFCSGNEEYCEGS